MFFVLGVVGTNICPEFTLDSYGSAREIVIPIFGDWRLHATRNNGRVVYQNINPVEMTTSYLYSLHTNNAQLPHLKNAWMVRKILQYVVRHKQVLIFLNICIYSSF